MVIVAPQHQRAGVPLGCELHRHPGAKHIVGTWSEQKDRRSLGDSAIKRIDEPIGFWIGGNGEHVFAVDVPFARRILPSEWAWKTGDRRRFLCEGKRRREAQKKCRNANNLGPARVHALASREDGRPRLSPALSRAERRLGESQLPSLRAMAMHASRSSSARAPSAKDRAATMPPTHNAAMARAVVRRAGFFFATLRSNMLTMALKTVSYARLTSFPLRATSLGRATIGHEFSTSSKCWRERYARTICGPTSVEERSTCTPSQQLFHSGSVRKHPSTSVYRSLLLLK